MYVNIVNIFVHYNCFHALFNFLTFLFFVLLVISECWIHLFGSRVALNPVLGVVIDIASAIFSHKQT